MGASLKRSEKVHWIQATHCHAIPVLRTVEKTELHILPDPKFVGLHQLGRLSPLFRKMWCETSGSTTSANLKTFQIVSHLGLAMHRLTVLQLCTSEDAPKRSIIQELVSPPAWNKKLAALVSVALEASPLTTLVCGPKSAGKSTFSKLLTNRLLTESSLTQRVEGVSVLDLDPGQPEYAPAGTLSLTHVTSPNLEPSFAHPGIDNVANRIVRCHALASVSPASDPDLYLEIAMDLFETYRRTTPENPLVINTPGWILGTGLDLLVEVITRVKPEEIVYMSEEGPFETVEALRSATTKSFTTMPSQQSEFTSRTAAHLRAMQMMSYFHLADTNLAVSRLEWKSTPLSNKPPLLIRYAIERPGILGVLSYDYQSPPELLAETINGMVLAVVEIEDPKAFRGLANDDPSSIGVGNAMDVDRDGKKPTGPQIFTTPEGIPFIPNYNDIALDPAYSRTIGLALIRGIDAKSQTLQVITPISPERIGKIRSLGRDIVLVHGKFDAPSWAYTEELYGRADESEGADRAIEVMDEDTSEDDSDAEPEDVGNVSDVKSIPWVEILKGNEKRPVGSRVWRVRRDLGRNAGD